MTRLPSGSSLARALACPASHALPQVESTSGAAERGTQIHRVLEKLVIGDELETAEQTIADRLDMDTVLPAADANMESEVCYSWNATAHVAEFGYQRRAPWIPLRIDLFVSSGPPGSVPEVVDYKTGWANLAEPDAHAQLLLGALCVAHAHRLDRVRVTLVHAPLDALGRRFSRVVDQLDLAAFAAEISDLHERIDAARAQIDAGEMPDVREGPHCKYCPALLHCPAKQQTLATVTGPDANRYLRLRIDDDTAATALDRYEMARHLVNALGSALHAHAAHTPIRRSNGKLWGPRTRLGAERVVPEKTANVIRILADLLGGEEHANAALTIEPRASKTTIRDAIRAARKAGATQRMLADLEREAFRRLREVGALASKTTTAYEEYDECE